MKAYLLLIMAIIIGGAGGDPGIFNQARSPDCFRKDTGNINVSSVSLRVFNQARSPDRFRKDTGKANISAVSLGVVPTSKSEPFIILKYEDFGPPSMAHRILGTDWWQWQNHGGPDPGTRYDIKVVVFSNITLNEIKKKFPVDPDKEQDFRYLPLTKATEYLDEEIEANIVPEVTEILKETRSKLAEYFKR